MKTEISLSEFIIKSRIKIGELAESLCQRTEFSENTGSIDQDIRELTLFLNAINSRFNTWPEREMHKRMEYYAYRFKLLNKNFYTKDWLDRFKPIPTIQDSSNSIMQYPEGEGYLYVQFQSARLVSDKKLTLNDI